MIEVLTDIAVTAGILARDFACLCAIAVAVLAAMLVLWGAVKLIGTPIFWIADRMGF